VSFGQSDNSLGRFVRLWPGEGARDEHCPNIYEQTRAIEAAKAISALHRGPSLLDWLADSGAVAITMGLMAFVGNIVGADANGPEQS